MGTIACPRPVRPNPPPPSTNSHPPRHFRTPSFPHAHTTQPTSHPPYQRSRRTSSSLSSLVKSYSEPPVASKCAGASSRHSTASSSCTSPPPPALPPISTQLPTPTFPPSTTPTAAAAAAAAADPTALDEFFSILSLEPIASPSPMLSSEAGSPIAVLPASPNRDNGSRPRSTGGRRRNSNSVHAAGRRSKSPGPNVMLGMGGTARLIGRRTPPVVKGGDGLLYSPPSRALTRNPFSRHASSALPPSPAPLLSPSLLPPPSAPSHGRHVQVVVPTASRINSLQLERPGLEMQGGEAGGRKGSKLREMEVEVAVEGEVEAAVAGGM
ncbi:hypothetical protein JCM1841_001341 [Sporobolomyces salmonicolor]